MSAALGVHDRDFTAVYARPIGLISTRIKPGTPNPISPINIVAHFIDIAGPMNIEQAGTGFSPVKLFAGGDVSERRGIPSDTYRDGKAPGSVERDK
jgi:hypothetical protein